MKEELKIWHYKLDTHNQHGEVREVIQKVVGLKFACQGCNKEQTIDCLKGYKHKNGLNDHRGNSWWVYYQCPCEYLTNWKKLLEVVM